MGKAWLKSRAVKVRVNANVSIWRSGREWKAGEVLLVGESDARRLSQRGMAEVVK
jgi:hypothetical protein